MKPCEVSEQQIQEWKNAFPGFKDIVAMDSVFWTNPDCKEFTASVESSLSISRKAVEQAFKAVEAFSEYIAEAFPETILTRGVIESDLICINAMKEAMEKRWGTKVSGKIYLKKDSHLPVSGSIKARGGFYEVLNYAENLARKNGLIRPSENLSMLNTKKMQDFFSDYAIGVGSTGNLGLSIGIMGKRLGFNVYVHMSSDAKQWKKEKLRSIGVNVIEHLSDYSMAVAYGREQAEKDANMHFVDDENSKQLFLGYSVAAQRLSDQLKRQNICVDDTHPLFVYLPCGVGGAAGGITLGLKLIFKNNVHCFFAEPTHSPCVLLGLLTKMHDGISVRDFGIDNITDADGLAVGRASRFVAEIIENIVAGVYTIQDNELFRLLAMLKKYENIYMEPSALASVLGPVMLFNTREGRKFMENQQLFSKMDKAVHIVWGTGGSMVPEENKKNDVEKGSSLLQIQRS